MIESGRELDNKTIIAIVGSGTLSFSEERKRKEEELSSFEAQRWRQWRRHLRTK